MPMRRAKQFSPTKHTVIRNNPCNFPRAFTLSPAKVSLLLGHYVSIRLRSITLNPYAGVCTWGFCVSPDTLRRTQCLALEHSSSSKCKQYWAGPASGLMSTKVWLYLYMHFMVCHGVEVTWVPLQLDSIMNSMAQCKTHGASSGWTP